LLAEIVEIPNKTIIKLPAFDDLSIPSLNMKGGVNSLLKNLEAQSKSEKHNLYTTKSLKKKKTQ
jgi:hypothetical protein